MSLPFNGARFYHIVRDVQSILNTYQGLHILTMELKLLKSKCTTTHVSFNDKMVENVHVMKCLFTVIFGY